MKRWESWARFCSPENFKETEAQCRAKWASPLLSLTHTWSCYSPGYTTGLMPKCITWRVPGNTDPTQTIAQHRVMFNLSCGKSVSTPTVAQYTIRLFLKPNSLLEGFHVPALFFSCPGQTKIRYIQLQFRCSPTSLYDLILLPEFYFSPIKKPLIVYIISLPWKYLVLSTAYIIA